ncbi:MAG TPA: PHP domain-containing protein [Dermatophilaceae bacterium]|jgi:error-prone DNA polymerase|nr:PHP domain-containing protein [Dermatophilaceae bacterium]
MSTFVHLHVASGYSMQYGASTPAALVARAAAFGQPALALTDRDGLYGAVRFVQACTEAKIAPILGVDLAVHLPPSDPATGRYAARPGSFSSASSVSSTGSASASTSSTAPPVWARPSAPVRTPVRGGAIVDPRLPRVTVLARGLAGGVAPGLGWARLCRLVTSTHLSGERGNPLTTPELLAELAAPVGDDPAALIVLLGPDSDVGRAVLAKRRAAAYQALERWRAVLPAGALALETVCHGGPEGTPASLGHAARMLALGRDLGVPVILSAQVRHADPAEAATVDVLDAARRLVALDVRHLDRVTTAGHLAPTPAMYAVACDIVQASGPGLAGGTSTVRDGARDLLAATVALASECVLDPAIDLGIGGVHLPEQSTLGLGLHDDPQHHLVQRCRGAVGARYPGATDGEVARISARLDEELEVIAALGYPTYFLTVATVTDLIRDMGVRVAARGSGAGSLVNYLLGISGVDPIRYDLLMERFCSPLRAQLPDIDIDVESARRTEIYEKILARFGGDRVTCVSMMDSYRVRHAIRDVGAALGLPPGEVDAMAKAFPHISARHARSAIADLPELRVSGLGAARYDLMWDLVERLDGLPRHIALHPCGVILSNAALLDRTPVEASWIGFPMSQFDKDDVEVMGLLKLDVLGIRMQSAMALAVDEVARVDGIPVDLDDRAQVPLDDEATFAMIRTTRTLGCFQIESPGQRELIGKFGPERFEDLVIDISLFRPGPVKSDMIVPFLKARHGWAEPEYLHPTLIPALAETAGVVVFHEQVLRIVAETTGVSLAQADEVRRALGSPQGQLDVEAWWRPAALARGYTVADADRIWEVLRAFASFGFCKAHAAAFALPTYQSAWLKTHHPAAFLAGVLTHDPGMYPKRLILDDARSLGIEILGLDVNASKSWYAVERLPGSAPGSALGRGISPSSPDGGIPRPGTDPDLPDGRGYGIRVSLTDVKGITEAEVTRIVAGQPFTDLADLAHRAQVSRPIMERLVLAGGLDSVYGISTATGAGADRSFGAGGLGVRERVTRRDLLLHVAELDRWVRSGGSGQGKALRGGRSRFTRRPATMSATGPGGEAAGAPVTDTRALAAAHPRREVAVLVQQPGVPAGPGTIRAFDVAALAAAQSQAAAPVHVSDRHTQMVLPLGDTPTLTRGSGLPELSGPERVRAELEILGLDASAHVVAHYEPMLEALGVTRSRDLLSARNRSEVWVAGVKVATQTPPIRSGRRVVFLTLDDGTGPSDSTFFEDVQGPYAATVFHSWLLLVRGVVRRTGARGISLRATGAWELSGLWEAFATGGRPRLLDALAAADAAAHDRAAAAAAAYALPYAVPRGTGWAEPAADAAAAAADGSPVGDRDDTAYADRERAARLDHAASLVGGRPASRAGGMGGGSPTSPVGAPGAARQVLVHASGFKQSPYADTRPPGEDVKSARHLAGAVDHAGLTDQVTPDAFDAIDAAGQGSGAGRPPRKLWHSSPGSSGH